MTFSTILERYLVREVNIMPYLEDLEQNLVNWSLSCCTNIVLRSFTRWI